jgi:hypothetical protein
MKPLQVMNEQAADAHPFKYCCFFIPNCFDREDSAELKIILYKAITANPLFLNQSGIIIDYLENIRIFLYFEFTQIAWCLQLGPAVPSCAHA